ncbi:lytic transglycosylase domain-containing protein [Aminobacter sp. MSH1]|uniref:lytic transglycosylase domain-containing protein n=1 Tax=Aminobacter sp. MSH1 TaxID=374606 RepID=UPI000D3B8D6C|nr:lytic transglycosylase domain-containing protein [Aminobacter sp. MSH1]
MATQHSTPSIVPLIAATILTSICAILPGELQSAEQDKRLAAAALIPAREVENQGGAIAVDAVKEARWGTPQREYVVGESGRIISAEDPIDEGAAIVSPRFGANETVALGQNHYGGLFPEAIQSECGPSSATPEEIERLVTEAARRYDVDVHFALAITTAESRLDRLRNSPKGARGPMQLMPDTAERFGVSDICDPQQNVDGGVRYLRELTDEFRNPLLVAAAYNAGEGRVREHGGIPPFKETVGYVAEVVNLHLGLNGFGPTASANHDTIGGTASSVGGVITSRERRQWVGGVMHF